MSLDWTHQFCLACDKQTDGTTYCSESCRLADYEKTSSPSSSQSSPGFCDPASTSFPWSLSKPTTSSRPLYLAPAYDFSNARPYGSSQRPQSTGSTLAPKVLSPSNSHSSLCSMKSTSSTDSTQLSEKAAKELRAYAHSFESVRLQRRRSY